MKWTDLKILNKDRFSGEQDDFESVRGRKIWLN